MSRKKSAEEDINRELREICLKKARLMYGDPLPEAVNERLEKELSLITENGHASYYMHWHTSIKKADSCWCTVRGTAGSSFVVFLLGISGINPLPAHYICPFCGNMIDCSVEEDSAYDLPGLNCPECGEEMFADGQNIPYESFMGADGEKKPNIQLWLSKSACRVLRNYLPGTSVTFPYRRNTMFEMIESSLDTAVKEVPIDMFEASRLFESTRPLGIEPSDIDGINHCVLGLSESVGDFEVQAVRQTHAKTFRDFVKVIGLGHGINVWTNNGDKLIALGTAQLKELAACREDVMQALLEHGMERKRAYGICKAVASGRLKDDSVMQEEMKKCGVPDWYIESCTKIAYMFPKAQAIEYALSFLRSAWYKLNYPEVFYASYFSVYGCGIDDPMLLLEGKDCIKRYLESVRLECERDYRRYTSILLCLECMARGIRFTAPPDREENRFLYGNGQIQIPSVVVG